MVLRKINHWDEFLSSGSYKDSYTSGTHTPIIFKDVFCALTQKMQGKHCFVLWTYFKLTSSYLQLFKWKEVLKARHFFNQPVFMLISCVSSSIRRVYIELNPWVITICALLYIPKKLIIPLEPIKIPHYECSCKSLYSTINFKKWGRIDRNQCIRIISILI